MSTTWPHDMEVLYSEEVIAKRVQELGARISADYADKSVTLVGILKGSVVFFADLMRSIRLPLRCDFMGISSYGDETKSSGVVRITHDLSQPIEGDHVLLVEDIVDSGLSMRYLLEHFATRDAASVKVCTLLHKPSNAKTDVPIAYKGFTIPDHFVVGYGLDYAGRYRNLPYIGIYHDK